MFYYCRILVLGASFLCMIACQGQENPIVPRPPFHELSQQVFHTYKNESLFGYSVAYQKRLNSLVVGAPRENQVGHVYLCKVTEIPGKCNKVPYDVKAINDFTVSMHNHTQWLGATVNAGESFFMACAPRFIEKIMSLSSTHGRCYYKQASSDEAVNMLAMKRVSLEQKRKYHEGAYGVKQEKREQLTDTFGLSTYIHSSNGSSDTIFVGGPAMSIGRTMVYEGIEDTPKLISVDNTDLKGRNVSLNFGYSITSGYFAGSLMYAISTPFGTIGYGRVHFYIYKDSDYKAKTMWIDGVEVAHVGSLFGASLASLQYRDRRSALLVGAPAFALSGHNAGAVFIYDFETTDFEDKPVLIKKLVNGNDGGYFGASIVCVGDFDHDEINEVGIAAPLENEGRGAVYIYSGKKLLDKVTDSRVHWLQKLQPEGDREQFFGWSLTALADADKNGCNELAVGAPRINSVILFRCIASINVQFSTTFPDLKKEVVQLKHGASSFIFSSCLIANFAELPDRYTIETSIMFTVKVIHPDVTIQGADEKGKTVTKSLRAANLCEMLTVLLPQEADYDQDIKFNVSVNLVDNPLTRREFNPRLVLLNEGTEYSELYQISMPGSDLTNKIVTSLQNGYLIGSTESETLNISMYNSGNTALGACVRTRLRGGIIVSQVPAGRLCSLANGELRCSIEKLRRDQNITFPIILSTKHMTSADKQAEIVSELWTSNCSKIINQSDKININLTRDAEFEVRSFSTPSFNVNVTKEELNSNNGKRIEHVYEITNNGVTRWTNVSSEIKISPDVELLKITVDRVNCAFDKEKAFCTVKELRKNLPIQIKVLMKIKANSSFVDQIKKGKAIVNTTLSIRFTDTKVATTTTVVTLWNAPKVPVWISIVASLVGLLLVVILIWILQECGCLQRENKQKLKELEREVKRQSMRKSVRQSGIVAVVPNEVQSGGQQLDKEGDTRQEGEQQSLKNVHSVKTLHVDDNDPARVAFNAALEKALSKGNKKVDTEAEIH